MSRHTCRTCAFIRSNIHGALHDLRAAVRAAQYRPGSAAAKAAGDSIPDLKAKLTARRGELADHLAEVEVSA